MLKFDLGGQWLLNGMDGYKDIPAIVPGSVIADLLDNNIIEDPYYGENEYRVRDLFYKDFSYSRGFTVTSEMLSYQIVELCCYGLDTLAEIKINGRLLAKTDNIHVTWKYDIKDYLVVGENTIDILFLSCLKYMEERIASDGEITYVATGNIPGTNYIRKAHCMCGWDWGPQLPDAGIWREICIECYSGSRLNDLHIVQQHTEEGVTLNCNVEVERLSEGSIILEIEVTAPNGDKLTKAVTVNKNNEFFDIHIDNPQLWWPNGLGEHPLYNVKAVLKHSDTIVDERSLRIGLRTIELSRENDQWGQEFCFKVNGIKIFAMGADYIPEDSIFRRINPDRTRKLMENSVAANFNCMRVWGGGYYPDNYFFDICDELGLVVWLDLMFACNVYRMTEEFENSIVLETEQNIRRLRHHASLGLICGNNEMEVAWNEWPDVKYHNSKLRADYLKQFEFVLNRVCKRIAPDIAYWLSSPSSGGAFDNPNDPNRGDVHYWDVWHGNKPFTDYRNYYFRFCSEFGFESFPSVKTTKTFAEPEDMNIFSRVMESHQKNGLANGKILLYIADSYRYPRSFETLTYTSQLLQAEALKYGVEHWRRNRGRCMGSVYWQLNDCWQVASWSSIDYFGRWKALHYAAKKFYAPILVSAQEEGTKADIYVTNDTLNTFNGTVVWKLRDNIGTILKTGTENISVDALSALQICSLDFDEFFIKKVLHPEDSIMLELKALREGICISENSVLFTRPKHFKFLNPNITFTVSEESDCFVINLSADNYARGVALELAVADGLFDDNWVDIYPDEVRQIKLLKNSLSERLSTEQIKEQLKILSVFDI